MRATATHAYAAEVMPGTQPTVVFDVEKRTITATVIVTLPKGASDINILTAPISIPRDEWTLYWDLVVDTPGLIAVFNPNQGIVIEKKSLPPRVGFTSEPSGDAVRWSAGFKNTVTDVNSFNYDIGVDWSMLTSNVILQVTVHDPTIVVTKDPIG